MAWRGSLVTPRCGMMSARLLTTLAFALPATALAASSDYPTRPIRFVVPSAPGGSPDINARLLAGELSKQFGQQIVVDNRAGASGAIGLDLIIKAAPDGYTLGYGTSAALASNLSVIAKPPYNPDRDLQMISQLGTQPNLLACAPSLPVKSVQDLIDQTKSNPGKLMFGSSGNGTSMHLSGELLKLLTWTQTVHVPYKAAQQSIASMMAGQVHFMFDNMGSIIGHVRAGRVRGLAVTSLNRWFSVPELPPLADTVPGFEIMVWGGVVFPRNVPRDIVMRMNAEVNKALVTPTLKERFTTIGYEIVGGTPEQFAAFVRKEIAKFADIAKRSGARAD